MQFFSLCIQAHPDIWHRLEELCAPLYSLLFNRTHTHCGLVILLKAQPPHFRWPKPYCLNAASIIVYGVQFVWHLTIFWNCKIDIKPNFSFTTRVNGALKNASSCVVDLIYIYCITPNFSFMWKKSNNVFRCCLRIDFEHKKINAKIIINHDVPAKIACGNEVDNFFSTSNNHTVNEKKKIEKLVRFFFEKEKRKKWTTISSSTTSSNIINIIIIFITIQKKLLPTRLLSSNLLSKQSAHLWLSIYLCNIYLLYIKEVRTGRSRISLWAFSI